MVSAALTLEGCWKVFPFLPVATAPQDKYFTQKYHRELQRQGEFSTCPLWQNTAHVLGRQGFAATNGRIDLLSVDLCGIRYGVLIHGVDGSERGQQLDAVRRCFV